MNHSIILLFIVLLANVVAGIRLSADGKTMSADNRRISDVSLPTSPDDAATKSYVDAHTPASAVTVQRDGNVRYDYSTATCLPNAIAGVETTCTIRARNKESYPAGLEDDVPFLEVGISPDDVFVNITHVSYGVFQAAFIPETAGTTAASFAWFGKAFTLTPTVNVDITPNIPYSCSRLTCTEITYGQAACEVECDDMYGNSGSGSTSDIGRFDISASINGSSSGISLSAITWIVDHFEFTVTPTLSGGEALDIQVDLDESLTGSTSLTVGCLGFDAAHPARTCRDIQLCNPTAPSGVYHLELEEGDSVLPTVCDLETGGGYWTLCAKYDRDYDTNNWVPNGFGRSSFGDMSDLTTFTERWASHDCRKIIRSDTFEGYMLHVGDDNGAMPWVVARGTNVFDSVKSDPTNFFDTSITRSSCTAGVVQTYDTDWVELLTDGTSQNLGERAGFLGGGTHFTTKKVVGYPFYGNGGSDTCEGSAYDTISWQFDGDSTHGCDAGLRIGTGCNVAATHRYNYLFLR